MMKETNTNGNHITAETIDQYIVKVNDNKLMLDKMQSILA